MASVQRRSLVAALVALAVACSGARPAPSNLLSERFDAEEAAAARELAPDLFAAAEHARRDAIREEEAGRVAVAEDHSTRARLLLDAAIAEADRIALEEERLRLEAVTRDAELAYARDSEARAEVIADVERREAARVAAEQAAAAFEQAVVDEERRYRGRSDEREALHRDAAEVLSRRAQLLLAAAMAEGAEDDAVEWVTDLLEQTDRTSEADRKVLLAERAVRGALVALGSARRRREGPTTDEVAALIDAARESGFEVEQRDEGVAVRVPSVFVGRSAAPGNAGTERLSRMAALVQAHPHGAVQVRAFAGASRLAATRAARAATVLVRAGASDERVEPAAGQLGADPAVEGSVEVVFLAYGPRIADMDADADDEEPPPEGDAGAPD